VREAHETRQLRLPERESKHSASAPRNIPTENLPTEPENQSVDDVEPRDVAQTEPLNDDASTSTQPDAILIGTPETNEDMLDVPATEEEL
jgi:hypothetical protein